jgi:hypothetical protein
MICIIIHSTHAKSGVVRIRTYIRLLKTAAPRLVFFNRETHNMKYRECCRKRMRRHIRMICSHIAHIQYIQLYMSHMTMHLIFRLRRPGNELITFTKLFGMLARGAHHQSQGLHTCSREAAHTYTFPCFITIALILQKNV